jgi:hypothetical protein
MAHEKLENLVKVGTLKAEQATDAEIAGLIRSGVARLADAKNEALNIESRFDLAYNAAHALSLAALKTVGFRSENRYLVFQCLQHTLDLSSDQWRVLDQAHRKRNVAEYEGDIDIDVALLNALIRVADEVASRIALRQQKGSKES